MELTKLDDRDRRILLALDTDASQTLKQVARKLRTSKEVVAYRMKQLEKAGVLNCTAIYNSLKLGLQYYMIYLKFAHMTEEKRKELMEFVKSRKNFSWLSTSEGSFDLMIGAHFPSLAEFEKYKDELFSRFDKFFQRDSMAILTEGEAYPRQYITGEKDPMRKVFLFTTPTDKEKLDDKDMQLLRMLSANSRTPLTEIAKALGMTERMARYRKRLLEKKGVIVGYKLFIDSRKLGYTLFKCMIKLRGADRKRFHDLLLYARRHPNIIYWEKVLGEWNLELHIEVASLEEFYSIAGEVRYKFADIVQNFDTLLVTEDIAISQL